MSDTAHEQTFCTACNKKIQRNNARKIQCPICRQWRHLKCTPFINNETDIICPTCTEDIFPFNNLSLDSEFKIAVSGQKNSSKIDFLQLDRIKFELRHDFGSSSLIKDDDLDVDNNYYNALFSKSANYCETKGLNAITPPPRCETPQFLLHINARSLSKNLSNLVTELDLLTNKPSIIAITETWALTDNDSFPIPGYTSILKARKTKFGGGVGLYIQDLLQLKYKIRSDLSNDAFPESLFIQVTEKKRKDTIIGVIYKPPDIDVDKYTESFEQLLTTISKEHRQCYILGDYNINLLKHLTHSPTKSFLDTLFAYGFYPLINKPTRITTYSTTLIDNIITNVHDLTIQPGIWTVDISDHLPVFVILMRSTERSKMKRTIIKNQISQQNIDVFKNYTKHFHWAELENAPDVNTMYNTFASRVTQFYYDAFPTVTRTVTLNEHYRPWITSAIKKSI